MPILPENKARYPADWKAISLRIRHVRAENMCECTGQCDDDHNGRCGAPNGEHVIRHTAEPHRYRTITDLIESLNACGDEGIGYGDRVIKIVLTVAHLDHTPENCDDANLMAMCQRCHLRYDREHHAETRRSRREAKSGQQVLF